jgi:putative membrane protein
MKGIDKYFNSHQRQQIEDAVMLAEKEISGEIAPLFVERSSNYPESYYKALLSGMMFTAIMIYIIDWAIGWGDFILYANGIIYLGTSLSGGIITAILTRWIPSMQRFFIGEERMKAEVDAAAKQTFLEYELFSTKQRTGILILISLLEHRVEILGDKGINSKIEENEWEQIIQHMMDYLKQKKNTEAMLEGIRMCKELLLKYGFTADADDTNELPNHLRHNQ